MAMKLKYALIVGGIALAIVAIAKVQQESPEQFEARDVAAKCAVRLPDDTLPVGVWTTRPGTVTRMVGCPLPAK